jgi:hypothetical protein
VTKAVRRTTGHRHTLPGQKEHDHEPQFGLPEALPADERLIWQGSPEWKTLAIRRFHVRKLTIYFAILLAARVGSLTSDGLAVSDAIWGTGLFAALAAIGVGLVVLLAWLTAQGTVYTLTSKRVVMRIGIVLTLSLNLPLRRMEGAGLDLHRGDIGDIAVRLLPPDHIAYLHLWPHARRWRFSRTEPTLLCLRNAQEVARLLTEAWNADRGESAASGGEKARRPSAPDIGSGVLASSLAAQ